MVMVWFGVLVPFEGATDGLFIRMRTEYRWGDSWIDSPSCLGI